VADGFDLETHTVGDVQVLAVRGELDRETQDRFQTSVLDALSQGPVVVDLSNTTFMGVSVLRSLVQCHNSAIRSRRPMVLAAAPTSVERMLTVVHAHDKVPLTRSVVAGLEAVGRLDALWNRTRAHHGRGMEPSA
jgi:anti-anti-sigma factor